MNALSLITSTRRINLIEELDGLCILAYGEELTKREITKLAVMPIKDLRLTVEAVREEVEIKRSILIGE